MSTAGESSSRYLSLALAARSAMASLRPVVAGEPVRPELGSALRHFLLDIQDGGEPNYVRNLQASGSTPSYEVASTFADITRQFGTSELRSAFQNLLQGGGMARTEDSAWRLIEFFDAVESQALDRYSACIQARMV